MYAIKTIVLAFVAFTASVAAAPQGATGVQSVTAQQAVDQCAHNNDGKNQVSCCNSKQVQNGVGIIGNLGNLDILGGECQPISIPTAVLGGAAAVPISNFCNQQAACCSGDQTVRTLSTLPMSFVTNDFYRASSTLPVSLSWSKHVLTDVISFGLAGCP